MLSAEQRLNRINGIGASDSPIIMGYSSYKTPYELYLEKAGLVSIEEDKIDEQRYWGNALEPVIIARFTQETGLDVTFPETAYHPKYPFIFANLDGWIPSENAVIEVKCTNSYQKKIWDSAQEDGIPFVYMIQIAKQCAITNASKGYCAVLIGGMEYMQFEYKRDFELEDLIINSDIKFWDCVQNRIEPDLKTMQDYKLKFKSSIEEKICRSTFRTELALENLAAIKHEMKQLMHKEELAKMTLMEHMRDAEMLMNEHGEILATWKPTKKGNRVFNLK